VRRYIIEDNDPGTFDFGVFRKQQPAAFAVSKTVRAETTDYPGLPGPDSPILALDGTPITATANSTSDTDAFVFSISAPTYITFDVDGVPWGTVTVYIWVEGFAYRIASHSASYETVGSAFLSEAGTYFLEYSGGVAGTQYSVWARVVSDDQPNLPEAATTALVPGTTQSGLIELPQDTDVYFIDVAEGDAIRFESSIRGSNVQFFLASYNSDFSAQMMNVSGDGVIEHVFETAGRYYLSVSTNGVPVNTAYSIQTSRIVDNEGSNTATSVMVTSGGAYSGTIDYPSDSDWIAIDLVHDQRVSFSLLSSAFSGLLAIYDANGNQILAPASEFSGFNAPYGGRFYISVTSSAGGSSLPPQTGAYILNVGSIPDDYGAGVNTSAVIPANGQPISATINFTDDTDWFRFTSSTTQTYRFVFEASARQNFNPLLLVYDSDGAEVLRQPQYPSLLGTNTIVLIQTIEAGQTIFLSPLGFATGATYTVSATQVADDQAGPVALSLDGTPVSGVINYEFDADNFTFTVDQSGRIEFRVMPPGQPGLGSNFNLTLSGPGIETRILQLETDGNSWVGVFDAPAPGLYNLAVQYSNGYLTNYVVTANFISDDHPNRAPADVSFSGFGGTLSGALEYFDDTDVIGVSPLAVGSYLVRFVAVDGSFLAPSVSVLDANGALLGGFGETSPGATEFIVDVVTPVPFFLDVGSGIPASFGFDTIGNWLLEMTYLLTAGDNRMNGSSSGDRIDGLQGHDVIFGLDGNDVLFGSEGDDTMVGGQGNDRVIGGTGNDKLVGGSGIDTFVVGGGGVDTISDFHPVWDRLVVAAVSGNTTYSSLIIRQAGQDVVITFANGGSVRIAGINIELLGRHNIEIQPLTVSGQGDVGQRESADLSPGDAFATKVWFEPSFHFTTLNDPDWQLA
jgi:Ca2+-binding RTX toxin-like protein